MLLRVDRGLERMKTNAPKVLERVFYNVENQLTRLIEVHPSKRNILQQRLQELASLKPKYEKEFPIEIWYELIHSNALPQIRAILPAMTWVFFASNKKQHFLTSNNPVFFFEWLGIGRPESEITFALSSTVALWATWRNVKEGYIPIKENLIREINRRIVSIATKYVYYSEEAQWVVNLINKKNFRLNRIK